MIKMGVDFNWISFAYLTQKIEVSMSQSKGRSVTCLFGMDMAQTGADEGIRTSGALFRSEDH
jgi:hypothetical protein